MLCTFPSDPDSGHQALTEFNNHSYFLSTQSTILRRGKIVASRRYNEIPKLTEARIMTNNQVLLPPSVKLPSATTWPHTYSGQIILDGTRKIASSVFSFKYGDYLWEGKKNYGNLIGLTWDDNGETSGILRIIRTPSLNSGSTFDYVEIPLCGARFIYDNYINVNGYPWLAGQGTSTSAFFPAATPALIDAVEFQNASIRAWDSARPSTTGWLKNDMVFNNGTSATPVLWSFNGTAWTAR